MNLGRLGNPRLYRTSSNPTSCAASSQPSLFQIATVFIEDSPAVLCEISMAGYSRGSGRVPTGFAAETYISESTFRHAHRAIESNGTTSKKRKREGKGDTSLVSGAGAYKGPWARYEEQRPDAASDEEYGDDEEVEIVYEEDEIEENPAAPSTKLAGTDYHDTEAEGETSAFVGSQEFDYQGRTYMHVPNGASILLKCWDKKTDCRLDLDLKLTGERGDVKNFHPKKLVHTYKYHTKSITQVRFFPDSGHLLLSASADSKIAIWDAYHQRELLRTYSGHNKSVNDIDFTPDGTQFVSASYDRYMKLWDTETGKCLNKFTTGKTPHVVRVNPSTPHEFLAGMSDKKILQYDTRSGKLVQEYDHHLGPVNTITFCDEVRTPHTRGSTALLTFRRTVGSLLRRTTSRFELGNTASPFQSSSLLNPTCSPWSGLLRILLGNT